MLELQGRIGADVAKAYSAWRQALESLKTAIENDTGAAEQAIAEAECVSGRISELDFRGRILRAAELHLKYIQARQH